MEEIYDARWQKTPEASGLPPVMHAHASRPTEGTIPARRPTSSAYKSPSRRQEPPPSRWSRIRAVLTLVPWRAMFACSFLFAGLVMFLIHGNESAKRSQELLDSLSSASTGFPHYIDIFEGSYPVTCGLAGGCIFASAFLACVRLNQKLIKRNKRRDQWGKFKYHLLHNLSILALLGIYVPSIWFVFNAILLAVWAFGCWTLKNATGVAMVNMVQWASNALASTDTSQPLKAFGLVCPSQECFNMHFYPWLESEGCLCSNELIISLGDSSSAALTSVLWTLAAVGCLWVGALVAAIQATTDVSMISSDWQLITTMRQRSQASTAHRQKEVYPAYYDPKYGATPTSTKKHAIYGPTFHAQGTYASPMPC